MDYSADVRIDESALEQEWLDQPELMLKYTKIAAEARKDLDNAEEALSLVKAELDKKIRANPSKFGLEKITEPVVVATILTQDKYKTAIKEVVDARFEKNVADGAVKAFEQRKTALENLVKLHGQSYFAGPSIPRDITEERKRQQNKEKANEKVGKGMKRNKKKKKDEE